MRPARHPARRADLGAGQCAQCDRGESLHPRQHRRRIPVLSLELRATSCRASARPVRRSRDFVCLDLPAFDAWLASQKETAPDLADAPDGVAFLASSGGTTGRPKGVQITNRDIETMNSIFWATMPVERAAGASDGGADDPCGGRLLVPAAALRRHQHLHGHGRSRRDPGRDRDAQGHARLHAADADLHAARPSRRRPVRLQLAAAPGLRRRAHVGRQAGRGDRGVRAGADPDLRPGRGLHDLHLLLAAPTMSPHWRATSAIGWRAAGRPRR